MSVHMPGFAAQMQRPCLNTLHHDKLISQFLYFDYTSSPIYFYGLRHMQWNIYIVSNALFLYVYNIGAGVFMNWNLIQPGNCIQSRATTRRPSH